MIALRIAPFLLLLCAACSPRESTAGPAPRTMSGEIPEPDTLDAPALDLRSEAEHAASAREEITADNAEAELDALLEELESDG